MFDRIKIWARALRRDAYAIYLAARSPDTPWYVKLLATVVAAYAFSPIDLIPDFIPVIGYLDDLILVPLGIWLVVSLIPNRQWLSIVPRPAKSCSVRMAEMSQRSSS